MGKYYAQHDGEPAEVCAALEEQYWPRFAGDRLPADARPASRCRSPTSSTRSRASSHRPEADRHARSFRSASRRAGRPANHARAPLDLDLRAAGRGRGRAAAGRSARRASSDEIWSYLMERLRSSYLESGDPGARHHRDVRCGAREPAALAARYRSCACRRSRAFLALPEARAWRRRTSASPTSCARRRTTSQARSIRLGCSEPAERQLFDHVLSMERAVNPLFCAARVHAAALSQLASLREDVDRFFDSVMVMAEDADVARESPGAAGAPARRVPAGRGSVAPAGLRTRSVACSCCARCCSRHCCSSARCSMRVRRAGVWLAAEPASSTASRAAGRARSCGCSRSSAD